jgi:hypothetical protein
VSRPQQAAFLAFEAWRGKWGPELQGPFVSNVLPGASLHLSSRAHLSARWTLRFQSILEDMTDSAHVHSNRRQACKKNGEFYLSHRLLPFLSLLVTTKSKPLSQARRQCQHTSPTPRVAGDPDGQRGLKSEKRPAAPAHTTLRRLITGALSRRTQSRKHQYKRKGSLGRATFHYPT